MTSCVLKSSCVLKILQFRVSNLTMRLPKYFSTRKESCVGTYDLVVVGGGIVGCATAREILERHPQMKIAIVEKENALAKHQTGHNSGVIHGGIYYQPGTLKAKLCVEGGKMVYDYCGKNNIPYKKCGKLIIATNELEVQRLNTLFERGQKNNVPDLKLIEKEEMQKIEPNCKGLKAIWSPVTGIVDWAEVCQSYAKDFQKMGGSIYLNFEVTGFAKMAESIGPNGMAAITVQSKHQCILTNYVLTCSGLHSDRVAAMTGCDPSPRIVPFRGEYLLVKDDKKSLFKVNVYPVPDPRFPFLGAHFTPRINGDVWLGPNAILALSREGYKWTDINIRDCIDMLKFPGLYKLLFRYLVPGSKEAAKSIIYPLAVKETEKFMSGLTFKDVKRGPSGVRAQAMDDSGNLLEDFVFDTGKTEIGKRVLHVRNAASPGATSSMAIGKHIADKLDTDFKFK